MEPTDNQLFEPEFLNLEYFFGKIYYFFVNLFNPTHIPSNFGIIIKFILAIFAIFFIFIIAYSFVRLLEIRKREHEYYHHEIEEYRRKQAEKEREKAQKGGTLNQRWDTVLQYLFSENFGDWKLAVIEADAMLEGLIDQLGFKGEGLGEKLKMANQENFKNLSLAWEAHIVRNKIVHEGQNFNLSHHEAKRIIALYEQIFREYGYI